MTSRRQFLRQAGAFTVGSLALPRLAAALPTVAPYPIGIQLFTLFRSMNEDPDATLRQVAAAGYQEVESAFSLRGGYYGYSAKEFRKRVEDSGLTWRAHHAGGAPFRPRPGTALPPAATNQPPRLATLNLRDNYQQLVDDAAEVGLAYLVCSSTPVATPDEISQSIALFQKTGEACNKAGVGFAYHNHATEFDPVAGAGKTPYELILSQTDKDLVKMELDLAWAVKAGKDPVALFNEQPGRFPLWHVKDIKGDRQTITEVGNGIVDFKRAFAAARTAGLRYFFVEQDMAADPVNSIKTSSNYLKKLLS